MNRERASKWDSSKPDTLKGCEFSTARKARFEEYRSAYIDLIDERLDILRHREEVINGGRNAEGLAIEYQLARVAEKAGVRDGFNLTHGWVGHIDSLMDEDAKNWLYGALVRIEEEMEKPWRGLGLGMVQEYIRQKKKNQDSGSSKTP